MGLYLWTVKQNARVEREGLVLSKTSIFRVLQHQRRVENINIHVVIHSNALRSFLDFPRESGPESIINSFKYCNRLTLAAHPCSW